MDTENMLPHSMNGLTGMNGLSGTIPPSTLNTPNGQQQAKPAEPVPSSMSDQVTDADFPEMNEDELKFAVIHELKVRIQAWVDDPSGNSRNLSAFARKAQVTDSTIRRIMSPGGGSIPIQTNLMRILLVLTGFSNTRDVVLYFYDRKSPIGLYLKKHTAFYSYAMDVPTGLTMEGMTSPSIPNDYNSYIAYTLVSSRGRASFLEVIQKMGDRGHLAIDRLIKGGLVRLELDGFLVLTNEIPVLTKETAINMGMTLVDAYASVESPETRQSLVINCVNEQGLAELTKLHIENFNMVSKIVNTNKGPHRVYCFSVYDTMEFKKSSLIDGGDNE